MISVRYWRLFLTLLVLTACAGTSNSGGDSRNPGPGKKAVFPEPVENFGQYREEVLNYLKVNSLPQRTAADFEKNAPFELSANKEVAYRGKFLLFHGLSDSAYVWKDVAEELSGRGYDVRAVLLPGHGSHPQRLLTISYKQWLKSARAHYQLWNTDSTPLYLGGFSIGGVISTILALEDPEVAGLLLFSPAYHSRLNSTLRWASIYAKFKPWLFGGMILEDNPMKYNSIPINSGAQYYKTTQYLKRRWGPARLSMPVMMVATTEDSVVDVEYTRALFQTRFTSDQRKLLLYTTNNVIEGKSHEIVRSSAYPDRRILNQSHLSLMNSPLNPLYGKAGKQLICNGNEFPIFMACMSATGHWFGAQNTRSPDGVAVARTTYNPDFSQMMELVGEVFSR